MMSTKVDINTDIGEGFGRYRVADDESLLSVVSSVNIACGFHAGDPEIMNNTVLQAVQHGVAIGAHPGLPDLIGFGRRKMDISMNEITTGVLYQLGALSAFTKAHNTKIRHVSPHGQLGHYSIQQKNIAKAIMDAIERFDNLLTIVTQTGELAEEASSRGFNVVKQVFADRAYNNDGTLVERSREGSVIADYDIMLQRALQMITEKTVTSIDGKEINIEGQMLVIHSDTKGSASLAKQLREDLEKNNIVILPST